MLNSKFRVEYGNFKIAQKSLTGALWKREIEQQHAIRIYTRDLDGKRSVNDVVREKWSQMFSKPAAATASADKLFFREYRALNCEEEPWKEEGEQSMSLRFTACSVFTRSCCCSHQCRNFDQETARITKASI